MKGLSEQGKRFHAEHCAAKKSDSEFLKSMSEIIEQNRLLDKALLRSEKRSWTAEVGLKILDWLSLRFSFTRSTEHSPIEQEPGQSLQTPSNDNAPSRSGWKRRYVKSAATLTVGTALLAYPGASFAMYMYNKYIASSDSMIQLLQVAECHVRKFEEDNYVFFIAPKSNNEEARCESVEEQHISAETSNDHLPFILPHTETLEGDILGGIGIGSDPRALLRSGYNYATRGRVMGGSTPLQSVIGSLYAHSNHTNSLDKATTKIFEMNMAAALAANRSRDELERFVATHWQCAVGAPGSAFGIPTGGINLCSRLLFNAKPEQLSDAQSCILASTFFRPFLVGPYRSEKSLEAAEARWERLKKRAQICAHKLPELTDTERAHVMNELHEMTMPRPDRVAEELGIRVNPAHRPVDKIRAQTQSLTSNY